MSDLQRYILEEWAEEYEEGRLNRREFLRRTVLMAGGTALAVPVLQSLGVTASLEEVSAASGDPAPLSTRHRPSSLQRRNPPRPRTR